VTSAKSAHNLLRDIVESWKLLLKILSLVAVVLIEVLPYMVLIN
jgi:hypothetical protein